MQVEELNRFLQSVRKTRLIDYLAPEDGEGAESALDRRLKWAARSRNQPDDAAEANFLLQYRDALREHLLSSPTEVPEDEWLDFTEEDPSNVRVNVYSSSTARESIDFDNLLPSPKPPPVRTNPPDGTGPVAAAREAAPTPTIQAQRVSEAEDASDPPSQSPAANQTAGPRSPSPLLERVRRNSPSPAAPRQALRPGTPSPPVTSGRTQTPQPTGTPRPRPDRWSAAPPGSRAFSTSTPGIEIRENGPAYSPPQLRTPTPSPTVARNATPNSFDVRITGDARFVQSGDRFGSSEVVYESDLRGGHTQTPSPHRTPSGLQRRGEASGSEDILGSLRGSVRKGAGHAPVSRPKAPVRVSPAVWLGLALFVVTSISVCLMGVSFGWIDINPLLGLEPVEADAPANPYGDGAGEAIAPIAPVETVDDPPATDLEGAVDPDATVDPVADPAADPVATKPADKPVATKPADKPKDPVADKPVATKPADKPKDPVADKPADPATPKPADPATTKPADPVATKPADKPTDPVAGEPADEPDPKPAAPRLPLAGSWTGSVGSVACLADFTQKGESVTGSIAVAGIQYKVSGRYNTSQNTVYLRGANDTNIIFKGAVNNGRVDGQARLGAGQLYQVWQLRNRK